MTTAHSTVGVKATLVLGGSTYSIKSVNISYPENGLNVADVDLALGYLSTRGTFESASLDYPRFTEASIEIEGGTTSSSGGISSTGREGNFTLFNGVLDDLGPASVGEGRFTVRARLLGRLAKLHTGSMQCSGVLANQYADLTFPIDSEAGSIVLLDLPAKGSTAIGTLMLNAMIKLTNTSELANQTNAANILSETFGIELGNADAAEILAEIRDNGAGLLTVDAPEGFEGALAIVIDNLLRHETGHMSFYNVFQELGETLGFRLLDLPDGISIVPFTPFVASDDCTDILPDSYLVVHRSVNSAQQCSGVALSNSSPDGDADTPYSGIYKRPSGTGQLAIVPAPPYLASSTLESFNGDVPAPDAAVLVPASDVIDTLGEAAAREICLLSNYSEKLYTVVCPYVRTDLAPCSPVNIVYPSMFTDIGTFSSSIYGAVKLVNINIDAEGSATTTITVGYARTSSQQKSEVDASERAHYIWGTTFTGREIV